MNFLVCHIKSANYSLNSFPPQLDFHRSWSEQWLEAALSFQHRSLLLTAFWYRMQANKAPQIASLYVGAQASKQMSWCGTFSICLASDSIFWYIWYINNYIIIFVISCLEYLLPWLLKTREIRTEFGLYPSHIQVAFAHPQSMAVISFEVTSIQMSPKLCCAPVMARLQRT